MNTASCVSFYTQSWKDLYQAAIHESDQLPERIADAETALVMRTRELFYASVERVEEAKSLDDAMCILHALRSSLKHCASAIQISADWIGISST
jgi:hypothetical protein